MTQKEYNPGQLETLFGKHSATAKVLDFMHIYRDWDYNIQDIAENSNLSPRHTTNAIKKLEKLEIIKKTRNIGNAQMYQYNKDNKAAMLLDKFTLELAFQECQKIVDKENKQEQTNQQIETTITLTQKPSA